jgi:hypothetical protein
VAAVLAAVPARHVEPVEVGDAAEDAGGRVFEVGDLRRRVLRAGHVHPGELAAKAERIFSWRWSTTGLSP